MSFDPNNEDQRMARRRFEPEGTVAKLRQVEVLPSQGTALRPYNEPTNLNSYTANPLGKIGLRDQTRHS